MKRFDLKRFILVVFMGMFLSIFPSVLSAQDLEIHYINIQQGGCTLIIGPDGTTILYDGGNENKGNDELIPYLQGLGISTVDHVIAGHLHTDHYWGLTEMMNGGIDALRVYENGSDNYNTFIQDFRDAAATTTAGGITIMTLGQVINLGNGAKATVVALDGYVLGSGLVPGAQANENDRSICLLVQYGGFDYLLTGDLGGGSDDNSCTGRSTSQGNVETPLAFALMPSGGAGLLSIYGVEVAHIAHHGSESSGNSDTMNVLSPSVGCISVGAGQASNWYHPRIDVVENVFGALAPCITNPAALVLQTEEGSPIGVKTSLAGYAVGDIIITTNGVSTYNVSATGQVSQGPDERFAAGLPATFFFDEVLAADNPPILYNLRDENVGETTADILWDSNEPADSLVRYGTTPGSYPGSVNSATLEVNHSLSLTGLAQVTTYYYVVESTDATNNTTVSDEKSFTTGGTPPINVVFSEVYYDTVGTDSDEEWVELYNNSSVSVDVSNWTITDNNDLGGTVTIPNGTTIAPGTYLTVAADSAGFNALYGYDADVYANLPGLNNSGDALILKDNSAVVQDTVAWEGGAGGGIPVDWGSTSAPSVSTGNTIVRTDPTVDTDTFADWGSAANNGDPQTQSGVSADKVLFSEVFYDPNGDENVEEWIELYNGSAAIADISNWTITDNNGTGYTFTFPSGTTIAPGTYLTVARDSGGFTALYGYEADVYGSLPFLNNGGDTIILYDDSSNEVDAVGWEGGASAGVPAGWGSTSDPWASGGNTIVRSDSNVDTDTYADWGYDTGGGNPQTQGGVSVTPVLFSEIFYDTLGDENVEEWLELFNPTGSTVDISGWKIIDNNGTGFTYTFPAGASILPGTYLTVARDSGGFTALYGYDADYYGNLPYLNNGGDTLILYDASDTEIDAVAWEGGASQGVPVDWGSTSDPAASAGSTIFRVNSSVDTDSFADWDYTDGGGNPQTQVVPGNVYFTEVYYDTVGTDADEEWFEFYNKSTFPVNIGGWTVTDNNGGGFTYTVPAGTIIQPNTFLTVAADSAGFNALYGYDADLYGSLPFLNNGGDTLIFYDTNGNVKDFVAWEGGASQGIPAGWGSTSQPSTSTGNTIVRSDYTVDTDTYNDWTVASDNGDPGTQAQGEPDLTPPVISNVLADAITIDSADISWDTDEPADSTVEYGTASGSYTDTVSDLNLLSSHSLALSGLTSDTTYYYRVISTDESGNTATSDEYSFTTLDIMTNTLFLEDYKYKNNVHGNALITVLDDGAPVEGAVVNITWSGDYYQGTDQGVTDANGEVSFLSGSVHPNKWAFTITIDSITKAGYYWDSANSETTASINKHKNKED